MCVCACGGGGVLVDDGGRREACILLNAPFSLTKFMFPSIHVLVTIRIHGDDLCISSDSYFANPTLYIKLSKKIPPIRKCWVGKCVYVGGGKVCVRERRGTGLRYMVQGWIPSRPVPRVETWEGSRSYSRRAF